MQNPINRRPIVPLKDPIIKLNRPPLKSTYRYDNDERLILIMLRVARELIVFKKHCKTTAVTSCSVQHTLQKSPLRAMHGLHISLH